MTDETKKDDNNSIFSSASITNNFDPIWIVLWITHVLSKNVKNQINQVEVCHKTDWSPNSCISDVVLKLTENHNWSLVKLSVWPDLWLSPLKIFSPCRGDDHVVDGDVYCVRQFSSMSGFTLLNMFKLILCVWFIAQFKWKQQKYLRPAINHRTYIFQNIVTYG